MDQLQNQKNTIDEMKSRQFLFLTKMPAVTSLIFGLITFFIPYFVTSYLLVNKIDQVNNVDFGFGSFLGIFFVLLPTLIFAIVMVFRYYHWLKKNLVRKSIKFLIISLAVIIVWVLIVVMSY